MYCGLLYTKEPELRDKITFQKRIILGVSNKSVVCKHSIFSILHRIKAYIHQLYKKRNKNKTFDWPSHKLDVEFCTGHKQYLLSACR